MSSLAGGGGAGIGGGVAALLLLRLALSSRSWSLLLFCRLGGNISCAVIVAMVFGDEADDYDDGDDDDTATMVTG